MKPKFSISRCCCPEDGKPGEEEPEDEKPGEPGDGKPDAWEPWRPGAWICNCGTQEGGTGHITCATGKCRPGADGQPQDWQDIEYDVTLPAGFRNQQCEACGRLSNNPLRMTATRDFPIKFDPCMTSGLGGGICFYHYQDEWCTIRQKPPVPDLRYSLFAELCIGCNFSDAHSSKPEVLGEGCSLCFKLHIIIKDDPGGFVQEYPISQTWQWYTRKRRAPSRSYSIPFDAPGHEDREEAYSEKCKAKINLGVQKCSTQRLCAMDKGDYGLYQIKKLGPVFAQWVP